MNPVHCKPIDPNTAGQAPPASTQRQQVQADRAPTPQWTEDDQATLERITLGVHRDLGKMRRLVTAATKAHDAEPATTTDIFGQMLLARANQEIDAAERDASCLERAAAVGRHHLAASKADTIQAQLERAGDAIRQRMAAGRDGMTWKRIRELIEQTECGDCKWRCSALLDGGFLVWATAERIDAGAPHRRYRASGRRWYVSKHSTDSEVVQTLFLAANLFGEHELREWFRHCGQPIFRPHHPTSALVDFTAQTPPDGREP